MKAEKIKLVTNLDSPNSVAKLINETPDGLYSTVSESGENVLVYMAQGEGMDLHFYQHNGWVRVDTYDNDGYKTDETFNGRY